LLLPTTHQGFTFYFSIVVNVFAISGLAGVLNAHRELIIAFFAFNAAQVVLSFTFFVDMLTDAGVCAALLRHSRVMTTLWPHSACYI
jgi:hypothetical protein